MRRLTHASVLAAFIFSCGGHWYALQCVAWVNMICDYSQFVPVTEAVSMTFSGQYPCEMCKAIAKSKAAERAHVGTVVKTEKKLSPRLALVFNTSLPTPARYEVRMESRDPRTDAPPTPPPRSFLS